MAKLDELIAALQEAQQTAAERDALKEEVRKLKRQLSGNSCWFPGDYYGKQHESTIDVVISELGGIQDQRTPSPVGPLVEASIAILRASKILLSQCSDTLYGDKRK